MNSNDYPKKIRKSLEHWTDVSVIGFTEELARVMDEHSISQAELAKRIDKSPAYVSKVLNGNANFTLKTINRLAIALDSTVHLHLAPENSHVYWFDEYTQIAAYEPAITIGKKLTSMTKISSISEVSATQSESFNYDLVNASLV